MPNVVKYNDITFPNAGSICGVTGLTVKSIDENTDTSSTVTVTGSGALSFKSLIATNLMIVDGKKYFIAENAVGSDTDITVKLTSAFYGKVGNTVTFAPYYVDGAGERLATNGYYTGQHKGTPTQDAKASDTQSANSVEASTVRYGTILGDAADSVTFPTKKS